MSYFRRPNPRSNWKRPKPKIYDCNSRDMENFYQNSYNEYLSVKNELRARDMERESRGDPEQLTRRFEQRRAASLVYGEDDTPRQHRFIPPNRQTSDEGTSEHSSSHIRTTRTERTESGTSELPRNVRSTTSASRSETYSNSLNADDSHSEMAGIEQRLERLRKLREELGLPAEDSSSKTTGNSSYSSSSAGASSNYGSKSYETSESSRGKDRWSSQAASRSSPTTSATENSYSSRTTRSSLRNGLGDDDSSSTYTLRTSKYKASDAGLGDDDSSSTYTSRNSRYKASDNGLGDDDTSTYTTKSTRFNLPDTNGFDSSSSSKYESTTTKRRPRVEKPSIDDIDTSMDDVVVDNMRKKFPSSSEILERIKNMDI